MTVLRSFEVSEEPFNSLSLPLRILIPAYNESARIVPMLVDYCSAFRGIAIVTVIANACTDDTVEVTERLMRRFDNLQLLVINGRIGKGGAIRAGLNLGNERYIGFADADGSTDAAEFARLFEECVERDADGVIGSRWLPGSIVEPRQPFRRRIASRTFNAIVRLLFGLPFADTQCGAKVFRRDAVRAVLPSLELANFAFDIDLLFNMKRRGFAVVEIPTRWADAIGTKVRFIATSIAMLSAVVRLRLQESWLFRLPFADLFARGAVIPVKEGTRVLVIGNRGRGSPWAQSCVQALRERGCRVTWNDEIAPSKAKLVLWYLFHSRREYEAIVEIASGWPGIIPLFSAKRCFLIQDLSMQPRVVSRVFSLLYRAVHRLQYDAGNTRVFSPLYGRQPVIDGSARAAASYIFEQIGAGKVYAAEFHREGDTWELRFNDLTSGSWTLQNLR